MSRALKALINCNALTHNLDFVQAKAPRSKMIAMIKANGYGHGLSTVANAFAQKAHAFGVACIEEALHLRRYNITNPIVLMEGFFTPDELDIIAHETLEPVIHHWGQVEALMAREQAFANRDQNSNSTKTTHSTKTAQLSVSTPIKIWIKIDTGMHRLGFDPDQFKQVISKINSLKSIELQGYITHFASAEESEESNEASVVRNTGESSKTAKQIMKFETVTKGLSGAKSLANSAAILIWPSSHQDWIRPGIMLYGVSPLSNGYGEALGLKIAMTLQTELIAIQHLKKGDAVGYGGLFVCPEPMRVGVVAVGYADGYPRLAPNGTPLLIRGKKASLVGRVSMDMLTVDLRGIPEANIGDKVTLWGEGLPVEEVAAHIGTLGYELLTGLSSRVPIITV